jgi:hypothetical protein
LWRPFRRIQRQGETSPAAGERAGRRAARRERPLSGLRRQRLPQSSLTRAWIMTQLVRAFSWIRIEIALLVGALIMAG